MGRMGIPTMAYGSNVFFGNPKEFGRIAGTASAGAAKAPVVPGKTLEELRGKLEAEKCRVSSLGWQIPKEPLVDPAKRDYRPTPDSGAKERGVCPDSGHGAHEYEAKEHGLSVVRQRRA